MPLLRWKEPRSFKQARARASGIKPNRPLQFLILAGIAAVCLGGMAFHQNPIAGSWPLSIAAAVGVGALVAFFVPWAASLDRDLIAISERGVGRRIARGDAAEMHAWSWPEISHCRVETVTLENRDYTVFLVVLQDGTVEEMGIDERPGLIPEIRAAVESNGRACSMQEYHQ